MVHNYIISSNIVNVLQTFQIVESYLFHENIALTSIQTVHIFTLIYFVSAL